MLPATIIEEEEQESSSAAAPASPCRSRSPSPGGYISSLVSKSSALLSNIKQSYSSYLATSPTGSMSSNSESANLRPQSEKEEEEEGESPMRKRDISERQLSDSSFFSQTTTTTIQSSGSSDLKSEPKQRDGERQSSRPGRPPLPPPPPRELVASVIGNQKQPVLLRNSLALTHSLDVNQAGSSSSQPATSAKNNNNPPQTPTSGRRHAIQEQSLERDAALSFRIQQQKEQKHKRTSSIKSALRHAHLGHLSRHSGDKHKSAGSGDKADSFSAGGGSESLAKSMPYELFEPVVTQRTFERSKRRDAMLSDPKRQLSADTIGLRQLTDEYLHNAGVKPMSSLGQCSLVALGSGTSNSNNSGIVSSTATTAPATTTAAGATATTGVCCSGPECSGSGSLPAKAVGQQPACSIEAQLYQASKHMLCRNYQTESNGSEDSLSFVTVSPGALPWQSNVSIQCELLKAQPEIEPYETTGDILNTIALPFKGSTMQLADLANNNNSNSSTTGSGGHHHHYNSLENGSSQLSATLKRGLSAVINPHNHLTPATAALQAVGGNLKKSLSNTLDITGHNHQSQQFHLHSQDSLPAYSYFQNESEFAAGGSSNATTSGERQSSDEEPPGSGGLMSQLASKLGRQSSKKFVVSKKGLHRALSFDCRGYKRLDGGNNNQQGSNNNNQQQRTGSGKHLLSTSSKLRSHNRSTLGLNSDQSPRPYLPQSASQVDFQLPLLPYHKMQEAIVSQRLLEPPKNGPKSSEQVASGGVGQTQAAGEIRMDADQLLCAQTAPSDFPPPVEPRRFAAGPAGSEDGGSWQHRKESSSSGGGGAGSAQRRANTSGGEARRSTAPRLILDIPTITMAQQPTNQMSIEQAHNKGVWENNEQERHEQTLHGNELDKSADQEEEEGEEDQEAEEEGAGNKEVLMVCLPSPNVAIEPAFNALSSSPSFCIDPKNNKSNLEESQFSNQLSANDVFSRSQSLIKRPSTFLVSDAMSQVARALNSTSPAAAAAANQQQQQQQNTVLRNRRQAIVPPKLATDGSASDGEAQVGNLVDVEDEVSGDQPEEEEQLVIRTRRDNNQDSQVQFQRRKRSGGSGAGQAGGNLGKGLSGSQGSLPTFHIEPELDQRPESQATNAESLISSGSSANLSAAGGTGRRSAGGGGGEFTVTSPGGLTVSFNSSRGRRRSSIAVIPQMQICPGDLLVYSKQLIDRMNQDESENEPPAQFLTIDDKKAKNIWSSLKLCAQFDSRTMKARNELLCSLEDVLASLQPSTFIDEQLSHYKGMLWNEFLYETESHRSASSDALSITDTVNERLNYQNDVLMLASGSGDIDFRSEDDRKKSSEEVARQPEVAGGEPAARESLKVSISSGTGTSPNTPQHRSRDPTVRTTITSRFREKPKLKRGQTVDSVFRIPLIPSSPLKHAQQHQQTPTAHLEDNILITIEDDERSSLNSSNSRDSFVVNNSRHNRSSSTRSRTGSGRLRGLNNKQQQDNYPDSSFDTDDAADLMNPKQTPSKTNNQKQQQPQIIRQSSLSTLSSTITRTEQKRQRALWDLFQSECTFFFDHLLTLKNVYMEPLKKIQVEGFAMFADPDVLFGNLDELCCGVYDFCKEFLYIIMRTLKTRPEELNATDVLIKLYKKNPKIDHLRGVYHRYTLNYINALTYLESLRKQVEFVEFEKWSSRDVRCKKLQLTDLLVAPVQHIMRVPIILKDIESHTENVRDREEIRAILAVEEASLRELDDKMRWLKNFERLLEIQKNISWPSVIELDPKLFIPEFLKEVLSKQPCERLIVSPRRQIVHEGTLSNLDTGKASDMHVILFDDMLLLTRRKKGLTKKASTVCKSNSGGQATKDDGSFKYIVYKQPLSLDRFYVHDVQQVDSQSIGLKHLFMLIVMNRFQQISNVHSFSAPNDDIKQTWLFKIKKTAERWKKNFSGGGAGEQAVQQLQARATARVPSAMNFESGGEVVNQQPHSGIDSARVERSAEEPGSPLPPHATNTSVRVSMRRDLEASSTSNLRGAGSEAINSSPCRRTGEKARTSNNGSREKPAGSGAFEQKHHAIELIVTSASHESPNSPASSFSSPITSTAH